MPKVIEERRYYMKLKWGDQNQLSFADEEEYYTALGIFANPKLARVYIEDNAKRGSFSDANRLHIYSEARRRGLPQALKKAMKNGGRINCNSYVDNLIKNHGFVLSGNVVVATLDNVLMTIPKEEVKNIAAFMKGYYLLQEEQTVLEQKITYMTESIDISSAKLIYQGVPKKGLEKVKEKNKQGKRDYIKATINEFEIGEAGERIVYNHERQKLIDAYNEGKIDNLNGKLEWVSRFDDSLGYDIISYDADSGKKKYIEVKTTTGSATTPFYMSENEVEQSKKIGEQYFLYRLYKMDRCKPDNVNYFILKGDISKNADVSIEMKDYRVVIIKN